MNAIRVLVIIGLSFAAMDAHASASVNQTTCYGFRAQDAAMVKPLNKISPLDFKQSVWCYRKVDAPKKGTLIYNADGVELRPELAAFIEENGTLTHASMNRGQTTIHKLSGRFNPLGVPLTPPTNKPVVPAPTSERFTKSVQKVLESFQSSHVQPYSLRLQPGTVRGQVTPDPTTLEEPSTDVQPMAGSGVTSLVPPWRGFWWSFAGGRLHAGPDSPLAKFDRYMAARGTITMAAAWEAINHAPDGNPWSGHCNGWAASSIIRPEPRAPITDPVSGVTFTIADQKGLLASKDNCISAAFFGERYNGWRGETQDDIYPGDFHDTVLYYIGQLRKPIAMDRFRGLSVDNHQASAFSTKITRKGDHFDVTTTLTMHKYDSGPSDTPGAAPSYTREFKYRLYLDAQGKVSKGIWLTQNNPDFIWVPLAPMTEPCSHSNPYVTETAIKTIFGY